LWEFPGGKLETDETVAEALKREIQEETSLVIQNHRPLINIKHRYPEKDVLLDVHLVTVFQGEATGREGQEIQWIDEKQLSSFSLPDADKPILTALQLPSLYAITPPVFPDLDTFLQQLQDTLENGIRLVQLRLPRQSKNEYESYAHAAMELCVQFNAQLMLKDFALANQLGCGLHLAGVDLLKLSQRPSASLVAASCHTLKELNMAQSMAIDFVTLSPVNRTQSHPDALPIGWSNFQQLADSVPLPVYALGGVEAGDVELCWNKGGQGVAGIRGLWISK
jgi:8-oxo-dGTP diphosphatase